MSYLKDLAKASREREKEREKAHKATTRYAVFPHSIDGQPTGRGFVSRPTDLSGKPYDTRNYGGIDHVGPVYKFRAAADRYVDRLHMLDQS